MPIVQAPLPVSAGRPEAQPDTAARTGGIICF